MVTFLAPHEESQWPEDLRTYYGEHLLADEMPVTWTFTDEFPANRTRKYPQEHYE
jgi:hypothetical protein